MSGELHTFQMKNTAVYMVLSGRRVVEWVRRVGARRY
jgi:hypothetical protein